VASGLRVGEEVAGAVKPKHRSHGSLASAHLGPQHQQYTPSVNTHTPSVTTHTHVWMSPIRSLSAGPAPPNTTTRPLNATALWLLRGPGGSPCAPQPKLRGLQACCGCAVVCTREGEREGARGVCTYTSARNGDEAR